MVPSGVVQLSHLDFSVALKSLQSNKSLRKKMFSWCRPGSQPGHLSLPIMPLCNWVSLLLWTWDSETSDIETSNLPNHPSPTSPSTTASNDHICVRLMIWTCHVLSWLCFYQLLFLEQNSIWSLTLSIPCPPQLKDTSFLYSKLIQKSVLSSGTLHQITSNHCLKTMLKFPLLEWDSNTPCHYKALCGLTPA